MFIDAFEDETGTLDQIEVKIARVTMIPRFHGEVIVLKDIIFCFPIYIYTHTRAASCKPIQIIEKNDESFSHMSVIAHYNKMLKHLQSNVSIDG